MNRERHYTLPDGRHIVGRRRIDMSETELWLLVLILVAIGVIIGSLFPIGWTA